MKKRIQSVENEDCTVGNTDKRISKHKEAVRADAHSAFTEKIIDQKHTGQFSEPVIRGAGDPPKAVDAGATKAPSAVAPVRSQPVRLSSEEKVIKAGVSEKTPNVNKVAVQEGAHSALTEKIIQPEHGGRGAAGEASKATLPLAGRGSGGASRTMLPAQPFKSKPVRYADDDAGFSPWKPEQRTSVDQGAGREAAPSALIEKIILPEDAGQSRDFSRYSPRRTLRTTPPGKPFQSTLVRYVDDDKGFKPSDPGGIANAAKDAGRGDTSTAIPLPKVAGQSRSFTGQGSGGYSKTRSSVVPFRSRLVRYAASDEGFELVDTDHKIAYHRQAIREDAHSAFKEKIIQPEFVRQYSPYFSAEGFEGTAGSSRRMGLVGTVGKAMRRKIESAVSAVGDDDSISGRAKGLASKYSKVVAKDYKKETPIF